MHLNWKEIAKEVYDENNYTVPYNIYLLYIRFYYYHGTEGMRIAKSAFRLIYLGTFLIGKKVCNLKINEAKEKLYHIQHVDRSNLKEDSEEYYNKIINTFTNIKNFHGKVYKTSKRFFVLSEHGKRKRFRC